MGSLLWASSSCKTTQNWVIRCFTISIPVLQLHVYLILAHMECKQRKLCYKHFKQGKAWKWLFLIFTDVLHARDNIAIVRWEVWTLSLASLHLPYSVTYLDLVWVCQVKPQVALKWEIIITCIMQFQFNSLARFNILLRTRNTFK